MFIFLKTTAGNSGVKVLIIRKYMVNPANNWILLNEC